MAEIPSAPEVARHLADVLEAAAIPYAVGGAIAYGLHAPPRATNDVDLNVFLDLERLDELIDTLKGADVDVDRSSALAAAENDGYFQARVKGMRVDVFVPSIPFYEDVERRLIDGLLLGRPIKVLGAEDLVVFKMLFFRPKDVLDVQRLVAFQGEDLDHDYIRGWLVEMVDGDDVRVTRWDEIVSMYG